MGKKKPAKEIRDLQGAKGESIGQWVELSTLRPWRKNPRRNKPVDEVARSIARFGFTNPILVQASSGEIIAGHTRYEAAKSLGMETVPVRFLDVTDVEAHAIAVADNRLGEAAEWDDDLLAEVLTDLRNAEVDLVDVGYTDAQLDEIVAKASEGFGDDPADTALPDESADNQASQLKGQFIVLIECVDEDEQLRTLEALKQDGYNCRALQS